VAGWTLNRRATSAAVLRPFETIFVITYSQVFSKQFGVYADELDGHENTPRNDQCQFKVGRLEPRTRLPSGLLQTGPILLGLGLDLR
jgi:hypothetical protein